MTDLSAVLGGWFAGGCGGLVRTFAVRSPIQTWKDGVINVVTGAICAAYLGPITQSVLGGMFRLDSLDPDAALRLSQFVTGVAGVVVVGMIIDLAAAYAGRKVKSAGGSENDKE